jgi:hypothetical protein
VYAIVAKLKEHIDVFLVLEGSIELTYGLVFDSFMQLDFRDHLGIPEDTFCLALGFYKFFLVIILRANFFLSSIR